MQGPCFVDIVGTFRKHLPAKGKEGQQILLKCNIKGFEWDGNSWEELELPKIFVFIDTTSGQAIVSAGQAARSSSSGMVGGC